MLKVDKVISIYNSDYSLYLYGQEGGDSTSAIGDYDPIVTELEGWDDTDIVEIVTEPALNRAGSYLVSKRIAEREITVTFSLHSASEVALRGNYITPLKAQMYSMGAVKIKRAFTKNNVATNGTVTYLGEDTEELTNAYISSITYDQQDLTAELVVTLKVLNPIKNLEFTDENGNKTTSKGI